MSVRDYTASRQRPGGPGMVAHDDGRHYTESAMTQSHRPPRRHGEDDGEPEPGGMPVEPGDGAPEPGRPAEPDPDGAPQPPGP